MAYPVALAVAAAATAAGTGMQIAAQNKAENAVARQRREELQRQSEFQRKGNQAVADSLAASGRDTAEQQIDAGAARREAEYQKLAAAAPTQDAGRQTPNTVVSAPVATAASNQQAATAAWNRILSPAQARAGGYADWGLAQNIKNRRANETLAFNNQDARRSAEVNQLELEQASHAGDSLAGIGHVLGAMGSLAGSYAATAPGSVKSAPGLAVQSADLDPVRVSGAGEPLPWGQNWPERLW